jgi:hypothetical protein
VTLTDAELEAIYRWIEAGAEAPPDD